MSSIIPCEGVRGAVLDVGALGWVLARMTPGLWAPILPGESLDEALTRREAARDVLDELLAEYAAGGAA